HRWGNCRGGAWLHFPFVQLAQVDPPMHCSVVVAEDHRMSRMIAARGAVADEGAGRALLALWVDGLGVYTGS
ncbi:hypothetical protein LCGC14_2477420, partial [marine sediment metagenome]